MPKVLPIQTSFSAGELSPFMYGRVETDGYKAGLKECLNMWPDSRGPAVGRGGSQYITQVTGNDGRVFALPVSALFFYSAILTHELLTIGSMVGHNPSEIYNSNPSFLQGDTDWSSDTGHGSASVAFNIGNVVLQSSANPNGWAEVYQEVTLPAPGDYDLLWSFSGDEDMEIRVGTTQGGTDIFIDTTVEPGIGSEVITVPGTTAWITIRRNQGAVWTNTVNYFGVSSVGSAPITFVTPYDETDLATLQVVYEPAGKNVYILHERYPVQKLTYDYAADSFTFAEVAFTNPPAEWTGNNHPSAGTFFEGRLWLGGTPAEPQTFWGSMSGSPEDFTQGVNDADGITFTLAAYGRIEWFAGLKNLIIGTANGEHIIASNQGVITPSDIKVLQQSSYGSANIQPVQVGDQIFYVSPDRRKVRAIQYEWQEDNWLSRDLTFTSEHITLGKIRRIVWQQNPNNLLWCILDDGSVACLTYERGNNIYGWSKHKIAGGRGDVKDLCEGPIDGTDFLNGLIQYNDGTMYFETQPGVTRNFAMDSFIEREPEESDNLLVTGLDHLEGQDCRVLVDNAVHPNRIVVGGQITLQWTGDLVAVGLGFLARIRTLPLDIGYPSGSGSSTKKHWNKIYVRVNESANPLINGTRPPSRSPSTPMNEVEPVRTGDIKVTNVGRSEEGEILVEQDLPLPLTVVGLFGEMYQSKL